MIKLIVTDIDGTLIPEDTHCLDDRYVSVMKNLIKKDIKIMVASGRRFNGIINLFFPLKDELIFTTMNGGYICTNKEKISSTIIDTENVLKIINWAKKIVGMEIILFGEDCNYIDNKEKEFVDFFDKRYKGHLKLVDNLFELNFDEIKPIKISLCSKTLDMQKELVKLKNEFENSLNICMSGTDWIDVMNISVSKGNAIKKIKEMYNISSNEIICFGDQENDLSMFEEVEHTCAVENAIPLLKSKAKYIIKSNNDFGVLEVLEKIDKDGIY